LHDNYLFQCENCKKLQDKLEEKTLQLRLKEKSINDLQNIGKKMQVQLLQQVRKMIVIDKHVLSTRRKKSEKTLQF